MNPGAATVSANPLTGSAEALCEQIAGQVAVGVKRPQPQGLEASWFRRCCKNLDLPWPDWPTT